MNNSYSVHVFIEVDYEEHGDMSDKVRGYRPQWGNKLSYDDTVILDRRKSIIIDIRDIIFVRMQLIINEGRTKLAKQVIVFIISDL